MATDIMMLGGVVFDDWSTPEHPPFGGEQAMVVHKLPGGKRVIDTLGPNDDDITWHGRFYGPNAIGQALLLDGMRAAGAPLPLSFGGQAWLVVIAHFKAHIERYPQNILYEITCTVASSPCRARSGAESARLADRSQLIWRRRRSCETHGLEHPIRSRRPQPASGMPNSPGSSRACSWA